MKTNKDIVQVKNAIESANTEDVFKPELFISGVNTPVCVQLLINKPDFLLGTADRCDGVLGFNDQISHQHCRIRRRPEGYTIEDLDSLNGTVLNDEMLPPRVEYELHVGDSLKLSASTFLIEQIFSRSERNG